MTSTSGDVPSSDTRATVVVVGAVNIDFVVDTDRLPGAGETVVGGSMRRYGGGKGANAAVAAARAGARTYLVAAVGADDTGRGALAELEAEGVDVACVAQIADATTGVALIVVSAAGENQIAVGAGANMELSSEHVRDAFRRLLPAADCVLVSTEIAPAAVVAAVDATTALGVPCLLNPAPVIPAVIDVLNRGPVLTPNSGELADLCRVLDPELVVTGQDAGSVECAARVVADVTHSAVVVTRGSDGALLVSSGARAVPVAPRAAAVRDTTGAGDTFNGVLAFRMAAGDAIEDAVMVATVAASLSVEAVGARTGMPDERAIADALTGPG